MAGLTGTLNGSNAGTYTNLTLPAMILTAFPTPVTVTLPELSTLAAPLADQLTPLSVCRGKLSP